MQLTIRYSNGDRVTISGVIKHSILNKLITINTTEDIKYVPLYNVLMIEEEEE